jgi:hypothetical protein
MRRAALSNRIMAAVACTTLLVPVSAGAQDIAIRNATIQTITNGVIENVTIVVRDGRIAAIGQNVEIPSGIQVIDGQGMYVMPGLIDAHSHMAIDGGINEGSESVTPEVRIQPNPDDVTIYRALAGGVTSANLLHGSANTIGGQAAIIKMRWGSALDSIQHRRQRGCERGRQRGADFPPEGACGGRGHAGPQGFHRAPDMIDQQGPGAHEGIAGAEERQVRLRGLPAMADRGEELRIEPAQPCQRFGIEPIALPDRRADQAHPARVGDDDVVAHGRREATHPRRMRPHLKNDPCRRRRADRWWSCGRQDRCRVLS